MGRIEQLRNKLYEVIETQNMLEILTISKELDAEIVNYMKQEKHLKKLRLLAVEKTEKERGFNNGTQCSTAIDGAGRRHSEGQVSYLQFRE